MDASLVNAGYGALAGAITSSANASAARTLANASNNIRAINNVTAQHVNARNRVLTGLQRWAQTVRNKRVYESIEAHQEAATVNFNRARDARTRQNFAANIAEAEEQGRFAAAAAASGVSGSVVDVIDNTARVRNRIKEAARVQTEQQIGYDQRKLEGDQRLALLDNMDFSLILDNPATLDLGNTQPAQTPGVLSSAIGGMGVGGLQAVGTALGNFFQPSSGGGSDSLSGFLQLNDNFSSKEV